MDWNGSKGGLHCRLGHSHSMQLTHHVIHEISPHGELWTEPELVHLPAEVMREAINYPRIRVLIYHGPIEIPDNQDSLTLAQNSLVDARQDYQGDPSRTKHLQVRNAQDDVHQYDDRTEADTFDLLGNSFNGAAHGLGAVLRKKASATQLDAGLRRKRAAQQDFAKDPSESNRLKLQLAKTFDRATEREDNSNTDEIVTNRLLGSKLGIASLVFNNQNAQDESAAWDQYFRLKRKIRLRERAQALQNGGASPVAQQMLGLSTYGPKVVRQRDPAAPAAVN